MFKGILHSFVKASYLHFFTFPPKCHIFISSPSHQSVISSFLHLATKASYLHFFTFPPKRHIFISSPSHQSVISSPSHQSVISSFLHLPTKASYLHFFTSPPKRSTRILHHLVHFLTQSRPCICLSRHPHFFKCCRSQG